MSGKLPLDPRAVRELRAIFADAQAEIQLVLSRYRLLDVPGYELGRMQVLRKQVGEILNGMDGPVNNWAREWLPESYNQGRLYVTKSLVKMGVAESSALRAGFAVVDVNQLNALAEYLAVNMAAMKAGALNSISTAIRQSQLPIGADLAATRAVGRGLVLGEGVQGIQRDLLSRVLNGQFAPGGYRGTLEQYAELLARTRSREAQVTGMLQRCADFGIDLVRVPPHGGACDFCSPLQGAVFSISGSDKRFPPLSIVGPPPWHPNCADVLAPFVDSLASSQELDQGAEIGRSVLERSRKAA